MNDEYLFNYKVRFNVNAERVVFSMAIKNEKGLVVSSSITGSKSEKCGKIIKSIQKGSIYSISWNFKCKLITGNYYTNIGIGSFPEKKESFVLNRISDALVFKVQDIPGSLYGGICYLNQSVEICELEK